jgi:hypothetical protein
MTITIGSLSPCKSPGVLAVSRERGLCPSPPVLYNDPGGLSHTLSNSSVVRSASTS